MFFCYRCAYKHLAMAARVWDELQGGYAEDTAHIAALIGDLAWASDHVRELQPDIAHQIREDRLKVMEELIKYPGQPPKSRPAFEDYFKLILQFLQEDFRKHGV